MSPDRRPDDEPAPDEPPPILGRWRNVYAVVLGVLGVLVVVFYALTRIYS